MADGSQTYTWGFLDITYKCAACRGLIWPDMAVHGLTGHACQECGRFFCHNCYDPDIETRHAQSYCYCHCKVN